jgi:hypothetical protein
MTERAGLMMAMMQPPPTMEEEFQDWYDTEHFRERANCEGFVTAQRMLCLDGFPRYLVLYDLSSRAVLAGPGYGAIARHRYSQWTKRIIPRMWGHSRAEADQIYPGQARLGAKGVPTRLAPVRPTSCFAISFASWIAWTSASSAAVGIAYINSFAALAAFVAPWMMGLAKDATGSFTYGLLALGAVMVIGAFAVLGFAHDGALFGSAARRSGCTCG